MANHCAVKAGIFPEIGCKLIKEIKHSDVIAPLGRIEERGAIDAKRGMPVQHGIKRRTDEKI